LLRILELEQKLKHLLFKLSACQIPVLYNTERVDDTLRIEDFLSAPLGVMAFDESTDQLYYTTNAGIEVADGNGTQLGALSSTSGAMFFTLLGNIRLILNSLFSFL